MRTQLQNKVRTRSESRSRASEVQTSQRLLQFGGESANGPSRLITSVTPRWSPEAGRAVGAAGVGRILIRLKG